MSKLLFYVLSLIFFVKISALTSQEEEKREQWSKECQKESGISDETIKDLRNGQVEETPEVTKQVLCVGKKAELVDNSGDIIIDNLKTKLKKAVEDDEKVEEIINKCVPTSEETIIKALECLYTNAPNFSHV